MYILYTCQTTVCLANLSLSAVFLKHDLPVTTINASYYTKAHNDSMPCVYGMCVLHYYITWYNKKLFEQRIRHIYLLFIFRFWWKYFNKPYVVVQLSLLLRRPSPHNFLHPIPPHSKAVIIPDTYIHNVVSCVLMALALVETHSQTIHSRFRIRIVYTHFAEALLVMFKSRFSLVEKLYPILAKSFF